MTSCSMKFGDLKMVKVRRGRKGHQKSRSLVFRISRTASKSGSDISEATDSTSEELTSSANQFLEDSPSPLKIKIPKIFLQNESKESENVPTALQNESKEGESVSAAAASENFTMQNHDKTTVASSSLELSGAEKSKCPELRRSSRRILLKLKKDSSSNLSTNQSARTDQVFSDTPPSCSRMPGERKKRGRKPGPRGPDSKKRKYTRRGRPSSKFSLPRNFRILKPVSPRGSQSEYDKQLMKAPKNSIWTLVPKELFKSEFFKSHVMKVRFACPIEKSKCQIIASVPNSFPPSLPNANKEKIHLNFPKPMQEYHYAQQKQDEEKEYKRPTVIYFRNEKKNFDHADDHHTDYRNSQVQYENQYCNARNGRPYLYNKYHMVNDLTLTSYYEVAGGNLNEMANMAANLSSSRHQIMPSENGFTNCNSKSNFSGHSVCDLNTTVPAASGTEIFDCPDISSPCFAIDILTRNILVQSLRVLFDEEAVL